jgi:hypothetical protein
MTHEADIGIARALSIIFVRSRSRSCTSTKLALPGREPPL